ncbi:MAG: CHAT domain-containing protein [Candidatus Cryptobacteroides sp.]
MYLASKQYDKALQYAELALEEGRKISDTPKNYYWPYYSFAQIYAKMGDRDNCFISLDSLFMSEPYIEEPRDMSQLYSLRGMCHSSFKEYQSAFDDYKTADDLLATKYPSSDVARLVLFPLLGGMEHKLSHYLESESYYKTYADEIKKIYGEYSLNFIDAQIYLANAQGFANHIEEGCMSYSSAIEKLKEIVKKRLPYMNSSEREGFWTPLSSLFTLMTPYALHAGFFQNEYTRTCYDALLLSKAFLLNSERSFYEIVKSVGDEDDMNTYMRIALLNERIKSWEKNYVENADSIVVASNRVADYEKLLMRTCKSLGDMTSFMDIDYDDVKQALKKNEVLVDFTDFVSYSGDRRYAAYLIENQQEYPLLLPLFAESEIDSLGIGRPDMFYSKIFADDVIKILWSPLEKHLKEGTTVYYVPSQMLFQVCLESLPLKDGSLLGEHYIFVRLSSARELMNLRRADKKTDLSAVLYGGLKYDMEPEVMTEKAQQYDLSSLMQMRGDDIARGKSEFKELPGSKVEVEKIANILERNGFSVIPYIGVEGTEESFMNLHGKSPKILHLATHGFYYTPSEASGVDYLSGYSDAMLLSGLIMAGANSAWKGNAVPEGVLGGVLTANNISRLDLSGTDMVVLSACQSGLGDATAEGLYGLQRAFKKAGVGTMIMTLWNVVDKVTTEFMVNFYESLVENKWDKHKAFNEAKSKLRSKYPDPYYWAAFVMLD